MTELNAVPRFNLTVAAPGFQDSLADVRPEEFRLAQNYPNPFYPITTIRYALPAASSVRIDIFDMLGRRVSRLVDRPEGAGWHAGDLPSGLYVYRLSQGETTLVRTMMLLR
jgi:hypothetical protein